jgi:hypothetical protein
MRISFQQEMDIRDLNSEIANLESTDSVDSAQAAAATSHKDWLEVESVDATVQKGLSSLLSSGRAQKQKLEDEKLKKGRAAFQKYLGRGEPRKSDHQTELIDVFQN